MIRMKNFVSEKVKKLYDIINSKENYSSEIIIAKGACGDNEVADIEFVNELGINIEIIDKYELNNYNKNKENEVTKISIRNFNRNENNFIILNFLKNEKSYYKIFQIINMLGEGGVGIVYYINDCTETSVITNISKNYDFLNKIPVMKKKDKKYVIKLPRRVLLKNKEIRCYESFYNHNEARDLIKFMDNDNIPEKYKYKPIFYGKVILDYAIYPFMGNHELSQYISDSYRNYAFQKKLFISYQNHEIKVLPALTRKIIKRLQYYNQFFKHNDIKSENIIISINNYKYKAHIIDFGLQNKLLEKSQSSYVSFSPENIISHLLRKCIVNNEDYYKKSDMIGLFWIFIDIFTNCMSFNILSDLGFSDFKKIYDKSSDLQLFIFYLEINEIENLENIKYNDILKEYENMYDYLSKIYIPNPNFRKIFIDKVISYNSPIIKELFNSKKEFTEFLIKLLKLIKLYPEERPSYQEILENYFVFQNGFYEFN